MGLNAVSAIKTHDLCNFRVQLFFTIVMEVIVYGLFQTLCQGDSDDLFDLFMF